MAFSAEIEKNYLKIHMEFKGTPSSQNNPEKEHNQKSHISWY